MNEPWLSSMDAIERVLASQPPDRQFHYPIRHGSMRVGLYAPRGIDDQDPHDQDELYLIARGTGRFVRGAETVGFAAGDVLFVPARMPHRFEDFSGDFIAWVVFWGPAGGEGKAA